MSNPLLEQYPVGLVLVTRFCADHPDDMPIRRARTLIATLNEQPVEVQRIFKKRFNRWHIDIQALLEYHQLPEPIPQRA